MNSKFFFDDILIRNLYINNDSAIMFDDVIFNMFSVFICYILLVVSGWSKTQVIYQFHWKKRSIDNFLLLKALRAQICSESLTTFICFLVLQIKNYQIIHLYCHQYILPIITGKFIYLSTVHLMPMIMENHSGFKQMIPKMIGFISGILMIYQLNHTQWHSFVLTKGLAN